MPNEARHMTQERQRTGPGRPRSTCASKWEINKNPGLLPPRHRSVRHFHFPFLLRNVTSPDNLLWSAIHTLHNEPHGLPVNPGFLQGNGTRCQRLRRVRLSRENHQSASCLSIGLQVPLYQSDAYCSGFREIFYWGFFSRNLPKKSEFGSNLSKIIIIRGIQPLGRFGQRPELSQATGRALVRCILGKFLGVVCPCFPYICSFLPAPKFPIMVFSAQVVNCPQQKEVEVNTEYVCVGLFRISGT